MSDPHAHGIQQSHDHGASAHDQGIQASASAHAAPVNPFTEPEIEEFHKSDRRAGGAVVLLMTCIFSIGVFLYAGVVYFVMAAENL